MVSDVSIKIMHGHMIRDESWMGVANKSQNNLITLNNNPTKQKFLDLALTFTI